MPDRSSRSLVVLAFATVSVVWGSTYLGIRIALEGFPPFLGGGIRFIVAGALLFAFLRARGVPAPTRIEWRSALVTGVLYFVIGNGFVVVAEKSVSSGLASVLVATMPLWATLFERFLGSRVGPLEWLGIALGTVGVVVLNLGEDLRASGSATVLALVAPMGWASASLVSKRIPLPKGPMATASQMLAGGVALLVVSAACGERFAHAPSVRSILALGYLVVFGSFVGFTAFVYLLQHTRTVVATSYAYVNPVIALVLGVALAGERVESTSAIGAAIILGAVVLLTRAKKPVAPAAQEPTGPADLAA